MTKEQLEELFERYFKRINLTLREVFEINDTEAYLREERQAVNDIPEKYRALALHEEPYDATARLLGYRDGKREENEERLVEKYMKLRETWEED